MIAFLDASAVIYAVEGAPLWAEALKRELRQLADSAQASSEGDLQLARYDAFFRHADLEWVELSLAVVEQATLLRAEYNLRTPDALQAAKLSALRFRCGDGHGRCRFPEGACTPSGASERS